MNYTNPIYYQVDLTPKLINMTTEGGLDTSIVNGVSLQRTANMIMTSNCVGDLKVIGSRKDGESYDDIVSYVDKWITTTDTMYLYPAADVNYVIENYEINTAQRGKQIICENMTDLYEKYTAMFNRTAITQPVGNIGYTLGVGTLLKDLGVTVNWQLDSGLRVLTWRLVEQINSQTDLPVGGNSPDGTIGFVTIYADWNNDGLNDTEYPREYGYENGDPAFIEIL
jgi:hypothetical protein